MLQTTNIILEKETQEGNAFNMHVQTDADQILSAEELVHVQCVKMCFV